MDLDAIKNGQVLLIDKPLNWTSFDVVNKIRFSILKNFKIKRFKVGHAGTLDPLATGLLIVCVGKATKKINKFQNLNKTYTGTLVLGATTPSYDLETEIDQKFPTAHISEQMIFETAENFIGKQEQYPPIFSAIKKAGKKLYEHARKGEKVEISPRQIEILDFKILEINLPEIKFSVDVSKGTYIRSLAFDFGKALKSGAYLSELRRTKIGDYNVEESVTPQKWIDEVFTTK